MSSKKIKEAVTLQSEIGHRTKRTNRIMASEQSTSNSYRPMQAVKRHFFAMRNGVIADTLRMSGSPFRYIFGLNLPQLVEAAAMFGKSRELAEELWANTTTRESMLLAPMLMPVEEFSEEDARRWIESLPAVEVADILCHRLLRHLPFAGELAYSLAEDENADMTRYTAGRLAINIMYSDRDAAVKTCGRLANASGALSASIYKQLFSRLENE